MHVVVGRFVGVHCAKQSRFVRISTIKFSYVQMSILLGLFVPAFVIVDRGRAAWLLFVNGRATLEVPVSTKET